MKDVNALKERKKIKNLASAARRIRRSRENYAKLRKSLVKEKWQEEGRENDYFFSLTFREKERKRK